ncbi:hypothetical protein OG352_29995 [Streptomyces sp. NBC_01485]|uniref:hypothetical protein n=1 Tax=Streptomyces sp. NBC_01485 TaxID=2903884 RepID=UPI002E31A33D|nr:hypothetical protein [Streptomyces sp. NBC_01485]
MPASVWKPAGIAALLVAIVITATFLVLALRAARARKPGDEYLKWSFSGPVVVASVLSVLIGAWATDRTPQFAMDEFRTVLIPLTMGLSAHALVRARLADDKGTQWPTRTIPAALALLVGTLVTGATTYFGS